MWRLVGGHHRTTKTGGVPATGPPPSAWASWSPCPEVRRAGASVVGKECKLMSTGSCWPLHLWGSNHQAPCRAVTPTVTFRPFRCIPTSFWLHLPVSVSLSLSPSLWLCLHFPISVSLSLAPSPCLCPHLSVSLYIMHNKALEKESSVLDCTLGHQEPRHFLFNNLTSWGAWVADS